MREATHGIYIYAGSAGRRGRLRRAVTVDGLYLGSLLCASSLPLYLYAYICLSTSYHFVCMQYVRVHTPVCTARAACSSTPDIRARVELLCPSFGSRCEQSKFFTANVLQRSYKKVPGTNSIHKCNGCNLIQSPHFQDCKAEIIYLCNRAWCASLLRGLLLVRGRQLGCVVVVAEQHNILPT